LALSSDWAFMVSRDTAADYARGRAAGHADRFHQLATLVEQHDPRAAGTAAAHRAQDGPFAHLDARLAAR
ncbi:MAG TPA: 1,4-alpha-glucan branching protein domain-containing protein, partial [Candidatus Eisenbacteria bacterium]|nr:1,4-alpha-glucan branching protein domain-containing protein [Candidatus Eisenbacteria bacterium]